MRMTHIGQDGSQYDGLSYLRCTSEELAVKEPHEFEETQDGTGGPEHG